MGSNQGREGGKEERRAGRREGRKVVKHKKTMTVFLEDKEVGL